MDMKIEGGVAVTRGAAAIGILIGFSAPVPVGDERGTREVYRYLYWLPCGRSCWHSSSCETSIGATWRPQMCPVNLEVLYNPA